MRRVFLRCCVVVWQALRLCAVVLLCLQMSCVAMGINMEDFKSDGPKVSVDKTVCGKISGIVYEFPRDYVIYWPEYEGKSSWEPGFIDNKKGCEDNFRSLYMAMTWPEMQPESFAKVTSFDFDGLSVALEPWRYGEGGLRRLLKSYLQRTPEEEIERAQYDGDLGLYFLRGVDALYPDQPEGFFWLEKDGRMQYIGHCSWVKRKSGFTRCYIKFLLPVGGAVVDVEFLWGRLGEWREIVSKVEDFVLRGIKVEVSDD